MSSDDDGKPYVINPNHPLAQMEANGGTLPNVPLASDAVTRGTFERAIIAADEAMRNNFGGPRVEYHHPECPKITTQGQKACRCGAAPLEALIEDDPLG